MPIPQKNTWKLATKTTANPLVVPEPLHRIGPEGVSSGISVRNLALPCTDQIRLICEHYISKCSGHYENNKLAARYVHQMAAEVMSQLSGVSSEIDTVSANAEIMKQRIKDWEDHFPSSLSAIGHPKAIADLVFRQKKQIESLKSMLELEKKNHDKDVADVLRSMNVQQQAARNSTFLERQQLSLTHQHEEESFKKFLALAETQRQNDIDNIKREGKVALSTLRANLEAKYSESLQKKTIAASNEIERLKMAHKNNENSLRNKYRNDVSILETHIQELEDKIVLLHLDLNGENSLGELEIPTYELTELDENVSEENTLEDLSAQSETGGATLTQLFGRADTAAVESPIKVTIQKPVHKSMSPSERVQKAQQRMSSKNKTDEDVTAGIKINKSGKQRVSKWASSELITQNNLLSQQVNDLLQDHATLRAATEASDNERNVMELLLKESIVKNDALMRKIKNAEEINDELRNALSETCQKNRFDAVVGVVQGNPDVIKYVPHLLRRPDRRGI